LLGIKLSHKFATAIQRVAVRALESYAAGYRFKAQPMDSLFYRD